MTYDVCNVLMGSREDASTLINQCIVTLASVVPEKGIPIEVDRGLPRRRIVRPELFNHKKLSFIVYRGSVEGIIESTLGSHALIASDSNKLIKSKFGWLIFGLR